MSSAHTLDSERLKALVSELRRAAYDLREVDGYVGFRPDLRRIETEREARRVIHDPDEALKYASELEVEIPGGRFIDGPLGSIYWMDWIFPNGVQEPEDFDAIWEFALFGPPDCNRNEKVIRLFDLVASDATNLILHDQGRGDSAQSSWLIYLANRGDRSTKGASPRAILKWREKVTNTNPRRTLWTPLPRAMNPTSHWWAARLTNVFGLSLFEVEQAISAAHGSGIQPGVAPSPPASGGAEAGHARSRKRSTERGEGRVKLISALTKHHRYADGGCLNQEPIGNNELAKVAGVSTSTASKFFKDKFQGYGKYKTHCRATNKLVAALKLLNDEFAPHHLFGTPPPDLATPDDDERDDH